MNSTVYNDKANILIVTIMIVNAICSIVGGIICEVNNLPGYFVLCLIDLILGTIGLLLFKAIYNSFFWVIKEHGEHKHDSN